MLKLKPSQTIAFVQAAIRANDPAFLHGAPGIGKTSVIGQLAAAMKRRLIVSRLAGMEPTDLTGVPFIVKGELITSTFAWFPKEGDDPSIWFFDEWLQGSTACQNAAGQLMHERRLGNYMLPDNVYVCAASNRQGDRAGTNRMPTHIADRFVHCEVEPDVNDWVKWALAADMPTELIAFIRFRPELLSQFDPAQMINPSPRSWEYVGRYFNLGLPKDVLFATCTGRVGEGATAEFMGFVETVKAMPNPDHCLQSPKTAPVPTADQPAVLYALAGVLARRATAANMPNVVAYTQRLPEEFQMVLVKQAIDRDVKLAETRPYIAWAADHEEAMQ